MNIQRALEDRWSIIKAAGWWWAECPNDEDGCLCEAFSEYEAAVAHVAKHVKAPRHG